MQIPMVRPPPFHSERLVYRAYTDADSWVLEQLWADPDTLASGMGDYTVPTAPATLVEMGKDITKGSLMNIIICLPLSAEEPTKAGTPVGWVALGSKAKAESIHKKVGFGIMLLPEYQGKGYGAESVEWVVAMAFLRANVHKVEIGCFASNAGARKCYESVGFKLEGVFRKGMWNGGVWEDDIHYGLLADEWRAAQEEKAHAAAATQAA